MKRRYYKNLGRLIFASAIVFLSFGIADAQASETFDIATFQPPTGWNKKVSQDSIKFSVDDKASGAYCLITLLKSLPSLGNSRENFDIAWQTLVKGTVNLATAPEMQPSNNPEDWKVEMGSAPFEKDGLKGVAVLVTASGYGKMMNAMILTNTQAYEPEITAFLESFSFKKPAAEVSTVKSPAPVRSSAAAKGYGFTTTNFDDGWTSTVQEDWVQVAKGNVKVLLHYPTDKIIAANTDVDVMCAAAWNVLVKPRYSNIENYQITPGVLEQFRPYLAQANLTDNATGKKVFVVLFKKGTSGWIEIIAADKDSFIQSFGVDINKIDYYVDSKIWEPLTKLANYNKFAVAASDLTGKWTNKFSGMTQYVNAYTGLDAGMNTHSSKTNFEFGIGQTYKWDLVAASGFVGSIKFQGVKSSGRFSLPSIWQTAFSSIEGKPKTYNAHFSCIKGARILWLDGEGFGRLQ